MLLVLLVAALLPSVPSAALAEPPTYAQPSVDTWSQADSGPWRDRRGAGVHEAFAGVRWVQGDVDLQPLQSGAGPRHLLLDGRGHLVVEVEDPDGTLESVAAIATDDGAVAWVAELSEDRLGAHRCFGVGEGGTVWVQTSGGTLHGFDGATGAPTATVAVPEGPASSTCEGDAGLLFLPGNRVLFSQFCRIRVVDLDDGAPVWSVNVCFPTERPDLQVHMLVTSRDLATVYTVRQAAAGAEIVAIDAATGEERAAVAVPGRLTPADNANWLVDRDGGVVLATADPDRDDAGFLTRVVDDGATLASGWVLPFARDDGAIDAYLPSSVALAGASGDLVALQLAGGGTDRIVAVDVPTGDVRWMTPRSGGSLARSLVADDDGNVIASLGVHDVAYEVREPVTGQVIGQGPETAAVNTHTPMTIGPDGTLYAAATVAGEEGTRWVALDPGPGTPPVAAALSPQQIGAARATIEVFGTAAASATGVVARRGDDEREGDLIPTGSAGRVRASLDLTGAALGEWQVDIVGPDGTVTAPLQVVAPEGEKAIAVDVDARPAVRTGRDAQVRVGVRNLGNVDANAVPVVVVFEGLPEDTTFDVRPPGGPPPVPEEAPEGFSWEDVPLVERIDGDFVFVGLVPILGPQQDVTIPLRFRIPPGEGVEGEARVTARALDCFLTNDRQPAPWLVAGAPGFAQFDAGSCAIGAVMGVVSGGLGAVVTGGAGCAVGGILAFPSALLNAAQRSWGAVAWDVGATALGCAVALSALTGNPAIALGLGVAALGVALFACGGADAIAEAVVDFLFGGSVDPNEIVGPTGVGGGRYLTSRGALGYTVRFENLAAATFPAAVVAVDLSLDPALDPATFRLGAVGWADVVVEPPPGTAEWVTTVPLPGAPEHAVVVTVTRSGADLRFELRTVDTATGEEPDDPTAGFLPPNDETARGEGFVRFSVDPAEPVVEGVEVAAQASIVFDDNAPIVTNRWVNTFDLTPPTTAVGAPVVDGYDVTFPLGGEDATSGIAGWQLERVGDDGGSVAVAGRWPASPYTARAPRGSQVTVRARAVDGAGNVATEGASATATVSPDALERIAGADRIATAVEISRRTHAAAPVVVLARADTYPDALSGAPLAAGAQAPILLTHRAELPAAVADEVRRLGAGVAVLLGGTAAVDAPVEAALRDLGLEVDRVAGASRFATAAAVAARLPASDRAFLVEGAHEDPARGWPDALAVAPWAAAVGAPVLLATRDALPEETATAIRDLAPDRVTVVGGTGAISEAVAAQVEELGVAVDRLAGADRYATARTVAEAARADDAAAPAVTWLATGLSFADALAAGPAVAGTGGQLLLVHATSAAASAPALDRVAADEPEIAFLRLVGGTAAISDEVEAAVRSALTAG